MNKLLVVTVQAVTITYLTLLSSYSGLAHTNPDAIKNHSPSVPKFSKALIKERLNNLSSVIDINYTEEVGKRIKEYTVNYRVAGEKILGKVDLYFPMFEQEIAIRNLPQELKYVAVVESHLDITAKSKSGAVGLWQFIKSTATNQGLKVDNHIDERKDAERSTRAALEYLSDLYDRFGDWTLAIAAYNCGPGGVNKAIRKSGSRKYWELRSFLPKETQKYVPRIIAAMYLMQYYHVHNLEPRQVNVDLKAYTYVQDGKPHNIQKLSAQLGMDYNILYRLNPQYISGRFPKNNGNLYLKIPLNYYDRYLEVHAPLEYKLLLEERKAAELAVLKEDQKVVKQQEILQPVQPIRSLIHNRIRQEYRERKYYRLRFAGLERA